MARKKKDRGAEPPDDAAAPALGPPPEPSSGVKRITPVEIQHKEFRLAFRGYNERDVDAFLDEVTEEVARLHAETKRLRDQLEHQGTVPLQTGAPGEAEALVRRARDEAARIRAEAQAKAGAIQAQARTAAAAGMPTAGTPAAGAGSFPPPKVPISAFLAREREFLQGLAGLIQSHADAVKEDVRKAREIIARSTEPEPVTPPPAGGGPSDSPAAVGPTGEQAGSEAVSGESGSGGPVVGEQAPVSAVDVSRADTVAFETYPREDQAGSPSPEPPGAPSGQDPDEPWRPPVPHDGGSGPGGEGQGPTGDDEASPWRSEAGSTFGSGTGDTRTGLLDMTAQEPAPAGSADGGSPPEPETVQEQAPRSEPAAASRAPSEPDHGADSEDRSLRELFWGQD